MKKKKNKKPINSMVTQALIDLAIGFILLLISKLIE